MSTNKKITQLDELTPATWADDDVIAIVDISAQETKKIQLSTFRTAVTGVTTLTASTPLTVDTSTGAVTILLTVCQKSWHWVTLLAVQTLLFLQAMYLLLILSTRPLLPLV